MCDQLVMTRADEWRVGTELSRSVLDKTLLEDNQFLCSDDTFQIWAQDQKSFWMECFYHNQPKGG